MYDYKDKYLKHRVGRLIAKKRNTLGFSQATVAEKIGCSRTRMTSWEKGEHYPKKFILKLQKILEISEQELERALVGESPSEDDWHELEGEYLPDPPHNFLGQDHSLKRLREFILGSKERSILLHGMGGVGKTALVAKAMHDLGEKVRSPCFFINVRGFEDIADPEEQLRSALVRLIRKFSGFEGTLPDQLVDLTVLWKEASRSIDTVLVFDNVATAKQLKPLTPLGKTKWIVTSRHRLIGTEDRMKIDLLTPEEAQELAIRICASNDNGLAKGTAMRLGKLCDRLPLAVEVAAAAIALSPSIDVEEFLARLEDERKTLSLADDWEEAVIARLAVSVEQLPIETRQHWALLGLFVGGFSSNSAQAVLSETDALALIASCFRRHLVQTISIGERSMRYTLHDLLRAVALREIKKINTENVATAKRHFADHFTRWVRTMSQKRKSNFDRTNSVPAIFYEVDNLRTAFEFSLNDDNIESVEQFAVLVTNSAVEQQYSLNERLEWISKARGKLARKENMLEAGRYTEVIVCLVLSEARHLNELGRSTEAEAIISTAIDDPKLIHNPSNQILLYAELGRTIRRIPERSTDALDAFQRAVKISWEAELPDLVYFDLQLTCGDFLFNAGLFDYAEAAYLNALEAAERFSGEGVDAANACSKLAELALRREQPEQARVYAERAEVIERAQGLNHNLVRTLNALGMALVYDGNFEQGVDELSEALVLSRSNHLQVWETVTLGHLAEAYLIKGQHLKVRQEAKAAIKNAIQHDHIQNAGGAIRAIAMAYSGLGKLKMARRVISYSLRIHFDNSMRMSVIDDYVAFAEIGKAAEDLPLALKFSRLAIKSQFYGFQGSRDVVMRLGAIAEDIEQELKR